MDVVDTQVHINVLGTEPTLAVMDALGVRSVLIDEYLRRDAEGRVLPGYPVAGGAFRSVGPNAAAAAARYPDRFAYLLRVDRRDPALDALIEILADDPNARALRAFVADPVEFAAFAAGGYDALFAAAGRHGLPVFVTCPGRAADLGPYAARHEDVQFIIDHCGSPFDAAPGKGSIDGALTVAGYPNVAFKWAHAPYMLSSEPYPFPDLDPKLARVLDAFGRERVVWASDYTVSRGRQNWAESLFQVRHSPVLSELDKEWILGRTARKLLDWPAGETAPLPDLHA